MVTKTKETKPRLVNIDKVTVKRETFRALLCTVRIICQYRCMHEECWNLIGTAMIC